MSALPLPTTRSLRSCHTQRVEKAGAALFSGAMHCLTGPSWRTSRREATGCTRGTPSNNRMKRTAPASWSAAAYPSVLRTGRSSEGPMLKYIELKTGHSDNGPAWVARVKVSKSGRTVYFNGRALKRSDGKGIEGNHYDLLTGDEYWVSGVKKTGSNRHWAGSGKIAIEMSAIPEYLRITGQERIDASLFDAVPDLPEADASEFSAAEHAELGGNPRRKHSGGSASAPGPEPTRRGQSRG